VLIEALALKHGDEGQIEMVTESFVDVSRRKKRDFLKTIGFREHLF